MIADRLSNLVDLFVRIVKQMRRLADAVLSKVLDQRIAGFPLEYVTQMPLADMQMLCDPTDRQIRIAVVRGDIGDRLDHILVFRDGCIQRGQPSLKFIRLADDGIDGEIYGAMPTGMESTLKIRTGEFLLTSVVFGDTLYTIGSATHIHFVGNSIMLFDRKSGRYVTSGSVEI